VGNLYVGLLHYPVKNARQEVVASALTGLDLHDIARSAKTFGVERYFLVTPLASQRRIANKMVAYWSAPDARPANRAEALKNVCVVATLEDSFAEIASCETERPLLIATSAQQSSVARIGYEKLRCDLESSARPAYLLFGTGWGLASELLPRLDYGLPPIEGPGAFNHLSVRAAAAIILDRLRGQREKTTCQTT